MVFNIKTIIRSLFFPKKDVFGNFSIKNFKIVKDLYDDTIKLIQYSWTIPIL